MARKKTRIMGDPTDPNEMVMNGPPADEPAFALQPEPELMSADPPAALPEYPPQAPVAQAAAPPPDPELAQRLRKLEDAITSLAQSQRQQPSMMGTAHALVEASRHLLPPVRLDSGPQPGQTSRFYLFSDTIAELQAIYYMYVDPRYRLSWLGRLLPPVLLALFLTSDYWVKYSFCGVGSMLFLDKPIQLMLCYMMFKVVGLEARHYRQTAPDLPPSLRL